MKKILGYLILAIIFNSCAGQKDVYKSSANIEFIELGYGICSVKMKESRRMDNAPSGVHDISYDFNLIKRTDQIPAETGQRFGVDYLLKSPEYKEVQVTIVWTFPKPITNDAGETFSEVRYVNNKSTNENYHETYGLNSDYILVSGEWNYQMFIDSKKIYERKFYLK